MSHPRRRACGRGWRGGGKGLSPLLTRAQRAPLHCAPSPLTHHPLAHKPPPPPLCLQDIHFAYAGYAPLSVRLVQRALDPGGWGGDPTLAALPGAQFELLQARVWVGVSVCGGGWGGGGGCEGVGGGVGV